MFRGQARPKAPQALRQIARALFGTTPGRCALLYIAGIPLFAVLYLTVAGDFYHSTSQFELSVYTDKEAVLTDIKQAIVTWYQRAHGTTVIAVNDYEIELSEATVAGVDIAGHDIKFRIALNSVPDTSGGWVAWAFDVTVPTAPAIVWPDTNTRERMVAYFVSTKQVQGPPGLDADSLVMGEAGLMSDEILPDVLTLPGPVSDRLVGLWRAMGGFPADASNSLQRMLYLSATTITTTGFGDIVPTTDASRLLVTLEEIWGIVFAGAFFATVIGQAKPQRH